MAIFFSDKYVRNYFAGYEPSFYENIIQPRYRKIYNSENDDIKPPHIEINPIKDPKLDYKPDNDFNGQDFIEYNKWLHKGQRKLFLSEIQHLTQVLDSHLDYAIVVYAGSAPCIKAWIIHEMFPNVKFLLIDPRSFSIKVTRQQNHIADPSHGIVYLSSSDKIKAKYYNGTKDVIDKFPTGFKEDNLEKYIDYIYTSDNSIFINQQYLDEHSGHAIKKLFESKINYDNFKNAKTIFWSDLRSGGFVTNPKDENVVLDYILNFIVINDTIPDYSMVKFKSMYDNVETVDYARDLIKILQEKSGIDVTQYVEQNTLLFYRGELYNQAWRGRHSAETRLHIKKEDIVDRNFTVYEVKNYESANYYYNCIERTSMLHVNPLAGYFGMDNCGDCAIEGDIWHKYMKKYNMDEVDDFIFKLGAYLGQTLYPKSNKKLHGELLINDNFE